MWFPLGVVGGVAKSIRIHLYPPPILFLHYLYLFLVPVPSYPMDRRKGEPRELKRD